MKTIKQLESEIIEEEGIFNTLEAGSQSRLRKDHERVTRGERLVIVDMLKSRLKQSEDILKLIGNLKDPYPLNIFHGLENEDITSIVDLIKNNSKISPDRISAHLMRKARKNVIEELKDAISGGNEK